MGWKTVIIGNECKISLSMERLRITTSKDYHNIPLSDLDTVIFSHDKVTITIPILAKLVENNVNVLICDKKNDPIGMFQPFNNHSLVYKRLNNQINWKDARKRKLWRLLVVDKIKSEIDCLRMLGADYNCIEMLLEYKNSVYYDDKTNREAVAARIYFSSLFGNDFKRDQDNQINFALNYGYKIIASYISKCIAARGLLTQLGIHHIGEANPFNLTYDFIEPLRAIIDLWVKINVKDSFTINHKLEIINILNYRVNLNHKWIQLNDAIQDLVDSYIAFMNENTDDILHIDFTLGLKEDV